MRALEDRHWWYRGLRELVLDRVGERVRILDVGCGTGGMLARLNGRGSIGVDLSPHALESCRGRGLTRLVRASAESLPFRAGSFDAVLALDLLYHRWVEDQGRALSEFARVLAPGGLLILHLPAFPWLAGAHDRAVFGARRYTPREVGELVGSAGLEVAELSFRNLAAFAGACVVRPWSRGGRRGGETAPSGDLRPLPGPLDRLLTLLARGENRLLGKVPFPPGLSVWCVGRKGA